MKIEGTAQIDHCSDGKPFLRYTIPTINITRAAMHYSEETIIQHFQLEPGQELKITIEKND